MRLIIVIFSYLHLVISERLRSLSRGSAADRTLGLWVRIPLGECLSVCCECCVLSGGGPYNGPIPLPEDSYRVWRVCVRSRNFDNEAAWAPVR
jgi:hypothetical protein